MRTVVGLVGLLLGALVGAVLLLANPVAWFRDVPPLPADSAPAKLYRWDEHRGIEGGVADFLGLGRPRRDVALMDPALSLLSIGIVVLPASEGTSAALAVKVSAIDEQNSLWRSQLGTRDYWSIFWPGEGSVFAASYSNYWNMARDAVFAGLRGSELVDVAQEYAVSAPRPAGNATGVTGASGRYAGLTGEIRELVYPAARESTQPGPDRAIAISVKPPAAAGP